MSQYGYGYDGEEITHQTICTICGIRHGRHRAETLNCPIISDDDRVVDFKESKFSSFPQQEYIYHEINTLLTTTANNLKY